MDLTQVSEEFGNEDRSWTKSRLGYDQCRSITLDLSLFDAEYYAGNGYIPSGTPLTYHADTGRYGPHDPPTSEVQTITVTGTPAGGNYILEDSEGNETATINHNASAATMQTRLESLFGEGNVEVTGSTGGPYTVTYAGDLAEQDVPILVLGTNSLTGGTAPSVTLATGTAGGADDESGETLDGLLFSSVQVKAGNTTGRAAGALYWMGIVDRTRLPFPIPSTSESQVPHIRFEEG